MSLPPPESKILPVELRVADRAHRLLFLEKRELLGFHLLRVSFDQNHGQGVVALVGERADEPVSAEILEGSLCVAREHHERLPVGIVQDGNVAKGEMAQARADRLSERFLCRKTGGKGEDSRLPARKRARQLFGMEEPSYSPSILRHLRILSTCTTSMPTPRITAAPPIAPQG